MCKSEGERVFKSERERERERDVIRLTAKV